MLIDRLRHALAAATRLVAQIPERSLGDKLPNRDRTLLGLANHIVEIGAGYLRIEAGAAFDAAVSGAIVPTELDRAELATRSRSVQAELANAAPRPDKPVETFFGTSTQHWVLERCTWHAVQHTRQVAFMLERLGIEPDQPLGAPDWAGLPLPTAVWDG